MIILRPIISKDISTILDFPAESTLGMTNLPHNRLLLEKKIAHSENYFKQDITKPNREEYYFVLEDQTTGQVIGTCGVIAESSLNHSHFYQIETQENHAKHRAAPKVLKLIKSVTTEEKASEICSLYIHPSFRHGGYGRLLSLSRFLFIAAHKNRFEQKITVELRGYLDQNLSSPFWEAVGRHFCNLSFIEIMAEIEKDPTVLTDILPQYPIYIDLLPKDAQEMIGKTHDGSKPALAMLLAEGFHSTDYVDLFDGGPLLQASLSEIRTVKNSVVVAIKTTPDALTEEMEFIVGNEQINFRACLGKLKLISKTEALINEQVAKALLVKTGDKIRYVTAR
jgi:arginine N-succinyltransferase